MSSASSEQSCVREGAGYDEVFPLGQDDPDTSSDERNPSTTSPLTRDEDLEWDVGGSESDFNDGLDDAEPILIRRRS